MGLFIGPSFYLVKNMHSVVERRIACAKKIARGFSRYAEQWFTFHHTGSGVISEMTKVM